MHGAVDLLFYQHKNFCQGAKQFHFTRLLKIIGKQSVPLNVWIGGAVETIYNSLKLFYVQN